MATILALVVLDILLVKAVSERHPRPLSALLLPLLGHILQAKAEIEEGLHRVRRARAVLARRARLHLAVEGLVDDAVAAVLAPDLGLLPVPVPLVQLLREELEELVGVLFPGRDEVLKGLLLRDPEARQDIRGSVPISVFLRVEILEHIIHGTREAVRDGALAALVPAGEVEVAQQRVVQEALEDNVLVAGRTGVVDAPQSVGLAGCCVCV